MASGMRKIEALSVVGVVAVRFSVIRRRLVREDSFSPVVGVAEPGPDAIKAGFEVVRPARPYVPQCCQCCGKLASVDLDASFVGFSRPRSRPSDLAISWRRREQRDRCIEIREELGGDLGAR